MNKRGFELGVTMIVSLVLAIVMLSSGIYLAYKFYGGAQDITEVPLQNLNNLVVNFNCNRDDRFCALVDDHRMDYSSYRQVNVKLTNDQAGGTRTFGIYIFPNVDVVLDGTTELGTDYAGAPIQPIDGKSPLKAYPGGYTVSLAPGESIERVFLVQAESFALEGEYSVVAFAVEQSKLADVGCANSVPAKTCLNSFDRIRQYRQELYEIESIIFSLN